MTRRSGLAVVALAGLLAAGCATSATYRASDGTEATCYRAAARGTGIWLPGLVGAAWGALIEGPLFAATAIEAGNDYADCKSALEGAGFSRVPDEGT